MLLLKCRQKNIKCGAVWCVVSDFPPTMYIKKKKKKYTMYA